MQLTSPLIVGAGPLTDDLDTVRGSKTPAPPLSCCARSTRRRSTGEQMDAFFNFESHNDSFAEASSYAPDPELALGPTSTSSTCGRVKQPVRVPVIASPQRHDARRMDVLRAA